MQVKVSYNGKTVHIQATISAGKRFATRIFVLNTRLTPTQYISFEPTNESALIAALVINGLIRLAKRVIDP